MVEITDWNPDVQFLLLEFLRDSDNLERKYSVVAKSNHTKSRAV